MRQLWVVAVALALAGCLGDRSSACGDGLVCRAGTECVAALDLCAEPAQLEACAGAADGVRCATDNILVGACNTGVCVAFAGCGNGVVEAGEACDDGNTVSGDGCSADCTSTETCGNKVVDQDKGEQCDCGIATDVNPACPGPNSDDAGTCSTSCRLRCGDGVVSSDEACDPGVTAPVACAGSTFDRGLTTCSASCEPVLSFAACRYIGWRTAIAQIVPAVTATAPTSTLTATTSRGFYIAGDQVAAYNDYFVVVGSSHTAGNVLTALWALDDTTAVAVGEHGTIAWFASNTWVDQLFGTADLRAVWGRSASEVYAISDHAVLQFDGTGWSSLTLPADLPATSFRAIGGDSQHVYVAGDAGALLDFTNGSWKTIATGTTEDLLGVSSTGAMVVAVGAAGTIVQCVAGVCARGRSSAQADLRAVWGSAPTTFFAAGDGGTVLFYDGHVWRPLELGRGIGGPADQAFYAVAGFATADNVGVIVTGTSDVITYEGAAWSPTETQQQTIDGLWGSATDDVFAVGRGGTILHHDGLTWTPQSVPTTVDLHAVWGLSATDVYAVGGNSMLLHYDGATWKSLLSGGPDLFAVFAAPNASADTVIVAGTAGVFSVVGGALVSLDPTSERALWGTSASNVWIGGDGGVSYLGGSQETQVSVAGISGTGADDVYAVGSTSSHYAGVGATWTPGPFEVEGLASVTATSTAVFAVGANTSNPNGLLQHWDGTAVEPFVSHDASALHAVFMIDHIVFMAGADGTLETLVFHD